MGRAKLCGSYMGLWVGWLSERLPLQSPNGRDYCKKRNLLICFDLYFLAFVFCLKPNFKASSLHFGFFFLLENHKA